MSPADAPRWPVGVVLVAALVLGVVTNLPSWADPVHLVPVTRFTEPQLLATSLARANLSLGAPFSGSTTVLGWPDVADVRPVVWPMLVFGWVVPAGIAFNSFFSLVPVFNAAGGALLGRALGLGSWGRAAIGGTLALHPWVRETLANGQLEQSWLGGIAMVWACALWAARGSNRALALLGPAMVGLTFTGPHLAIAAGLGVALLLVTDGPLVRAGWRRRYAAIGLAGVGAALAGAWYAGNFTARTQVFWPKGSPGHAASLSNLPEAATFAGLLLPPGPPDADTQTLHPIYFGAFLLVGMLVGGRRSPWALWLAFAGLLLLAFGDTVGPVPGPFQLLSALSPALAASQSPYRLLAGVIVVAAALAARGITRGWHLGLFLGVGLLETTLVTTRPFVAPPMVIAVDPLPAALTEGAGAVLDLPLLGTKCPDQAYHYAIEAARRARPSPVLPAAPTYYPTVGGLARKVLQAWQARPCGPAMAEAVTKMGFSTVVLHRHDPTCPVQPSFEQCLVDAFGAGTEAPGLRFWDVRPAR